MGTELGDAVFRVPGKLRLAVSDDVLGGQDSPGALRLAADLRDPEYTGPESAPVEGEQPRRLRDLIGDLTTKDGDAGRSKYSNTHTWSYALDFLAGIEAAFKSAGLLDVPVLPERRTVDRAKLLNAAGAAFDSSFVTPVEGGFRKDLVDAVDAVLAELGIEAGS